MRLPETVNAMLRSTCKAANDRVSDTYTVFPKSDGRICDRIKAYAEVIGWMIT